MRSLGSLKKKYENFWRKLISEKNKAYVLMTHGNADMDAVASILIMKKLLDSAAPNAAKYIVLEKTSKDVEKILDVLGIEIEEGKPSDKYVVVLLDMSDPHRYTSEKMRKLCIGAEKIYVIDHHIASTSSHVEALVIPYTSTTEILLELAEVVGLLQRVLQDEKLAKVSMMGIITDTAYFSTISSRTFYYMYVLSQAVDYEEVMSILRKEKERDISQRMAILKALQRMMVYKTNNTIIAITHVGSFESQVANIIQQLGADITFVVSKKKEKEKTYYRVIARSKKYGITPVLQNLVKKLGGNYGVTQDKIGGAQIPISIKLDKLKKIILQAILDEVLNLAIRNNDEISTIIKKKRRLSDL